MTRRALLSVTDKAGIVDFGRALAERGVQLLSTGGTARALREEGLEVVEVGDFTGSPEILDGRVKTLHPKIHGGLLGRRDLESHRDQMAEHGIEPIDIVVVNLYRFREAVERGDGRTEIVEQIDIGGPSMIRSAAKNHASVAVVTDPADYGAVLEALDTDGFPGDLGRKLAAKAFDHTAKYDTAIAAWFASQGQGGGFPSSLELSGAKAADLRYGENPHQKAALYTDVTTGSHTLAGAEQRSGKELSYNNLVDLDAALAAVLEFDAPACVVVKHATPCGAAVATDIVAAVHHGIEGDPLSAFGGILAINRTLSTAVADALVERNTFLEAIVAPSIDDAAVAVLQEGRPWGRNVRLLDLGGGMPNGSAPAVATRRISGGYLAQTADVRLEGPELRWATEKTADGQHLEALRFAWSVCKHVRSNAIVLAGVPADGVFATYGIGGGQTSRVDAVKSAVEKAGGRARGSVLASDAFFPFPDGLEHAAAGGVVAAIQPGGSRRDDEVVAAANAADVAMAFTGVRHFRH